MKTEAVTKSIISNYKILSEKTNVIKPAKEHCITTWGLNYIPKDNSEGFVNEIGLITRKRKSKIDVRNGKLKKIDKPFFLTWNKTLNIINKMLESMISNYENSEVVSKKYVDFLAFPESFAERLSKIK